MTYPSSLTAFTLSAWICPKAVPANNNVSIAAFADQPTWGVYYGQFKFIPNPSDSTTGLISFVVKTATSSVTVTGKTAIKCDGKTWYYVVGSAKNSDKARLYINGMEDSEQTLDTIATPAAAGPFFVSRSQTSGNGTPYFYGYIGNIGLYFNQFEP